MHKQMYGCIHKVYKHMFVEYKVKNISICLKRAVQYHVITVIGDGILYHVGKFFNLNNLKGGWLYAEPYVTFEIKLH